MSAWDEFLDTFFRRPDRDGPYVSVLDHLDPAEREHAFHMLLAAAVEQPGAVFAIQGLAHLGDPRAIEPLRGIMRGQRDSTRLYAAFALWCIAGDREALDTLCRTVQHRRRRVGAAQERADAVVFVKQIDDPAARRALAVAIHDPEYDVRRHAYDGLVPVLGRSREVWNYVVKPDVHHHVRRQIDAVLRRAGLA